MKEGSAFDLIATSRLLFLPRENQTRKSFLSLSTISFCIDGAVAESVQYHQMLFHPRMNHPLATSDVDMVCRQGMQETFATQANKPTKTGKANCYEEDPDRSSGNSKECGGGLIRLYGRRQKGSQKKSASVVQHKQQRTSDNSVNTAAALYHNAVTICR